MHGECDEKQLLMPADEFDKWRSPQPEEQEHTAHAVLATRHALPSIQNKEMPMTLPVSV